MKTNFYKIISIVLSLVLVFTCCAVSFTALAEETVTDTTTDTTEGDENSETVVTPLTYYLSADTSIAGDDTEHDGSVEKPFNTFNYAITQAVSVTKANGTNSPENTVYFKIMGTTAVNWGTVTGSSKFDDNVSSGNGNKLLPDFDFTLNISSHESGGVIGASSNPVSFLGPVELQNIKVTNNSSPISFNANDIKVLDGVTFTSAQQHFALGIHSGSLNTVKESQEVYIASNVPNIYIGNYNSYATYAKDINIVYDYAGAETFYLGSQAYGTTTINKNVNFNFKNATGITTITNKGCSLGSEATIQIINSTGETVSFAGTIKDALLGKDATDTTEAVAPTHNYWLLTNTTTSYKDVLGFYKDDNGDSVDGKFTVADGYKATVVKKGETEGVLIEAPFGEGDKVLDLSAVPGEYDVTIERMPWKVTYYISADDGSDETGKGTEEKPFATLSKALTLAKDNNYTAGDIVTVVVKGTTTIADDTNLPEHDFKLIIKSSGDSVGTIQASNKNLGGDTELQNIKLLGFHINNKNFTADATSTIQAQYLRTGSWAFKSVKDINQNITVNGTLDGTNLYIGNQYGGNTYNKVNIFINNLGHTNKTYSAIGFGVGQQTLTTTYNGPINLEIRNATVLNFNTVRYCSYGENFSFQFLNSTGISDFDRTGIDKFPQEKVYILTNNTDNKELLSFTSEVGVYDIDENVDLSFYDVKATRAADEDAGITAVTYFSKDGKLSIKEAGEYTITVEKKTGLTKKYYASANGGDDDNGDGTIEKPFATVDGAIRYANSMKYATGDEVTLKVMDGTTVPWGVADAANLTQYDFKLIFDSEGETMGTVGASQDVQFNGPTEFRRIKIIGGLNQIIGANGNDVTVGSQTIFSGSTNIATGSYNKGGNFAKDVNLYFGAKPTSIRVGSVYTTTTYDCDINITYDISGATQSFSIGNQHNTMSKFGKNINFNILNANSIILANSTLYEFADTGAVQIINSTGSSITNSLTLKNTSGNDVPKWIITNKTTNIKDALGFVSGTSGEYTVADGYTVVAYDANNTQVAESKNGYLDIAQNGTYSAGEYYVVCTQDGDINADENYDNNVYDIRDLVYVNEQITANPEWFVSSADKNSDGVIDSDDIAIIRQELLTGEKYIPESNNDETQVTTLSAVDAIDKTSLLALYSVKSNANCICDRRLSVHYI